MREFLLERKEREREREREGDRLGEKIEFDIFVRFSLAARARVKISDGVHPPLRRVRNEDFLSARAWSPRPPVFPPSRVKGGGIGS